MEKIHCRFRNWYFVTINQFVQTTISFYFAMSRGNVSFMSSEQLWFFFPITWTSSLLISPRVVYQPSRISGHILQLYLFCGWYNTFWENGKNIFVTSLKWLYSYYITAHFMQNICKITFKFRLMYFFKLQRNEVLLSNFICAAWRPNQIKTRNNYNNYTNNALNVYFKYVKETDMEIKYKSN